ncbi:MAG: GlcG/HbpS family heme-binding protein [Cytophagales bacterium]
MKNFIILLLLTVIATFSSFAQLNTKYYLDNKAAKKIMAAALAFAKENNSPGGSIAIVDESGSLVLLEKLDNTFSKASEVSISKAQTAVLFKKETKFFEDKINSDRVAMLSVGVNMLKGGVPIFYKGQIVGAVGVSGASSAEQDAQIAEAGAKVDLEK